MLKLQKSGMERRLCMLDDFAIFICTYGRPDNQLTLSTLKECGYSGKIYLVLDDTDTTIQQYIDNYGSDNIIVFDKNYYINNCIDTGDNKGHYKCILYAKNAVEDIAKELQLQSFVIADDDIGKFRFRYPYDDKMKSVSISNNFDLILDTCIDYLLSCNIASIGFCFSQMYFSGVSVLNDLHKFRVPYNFVFRNTSINVDWHSWFGEDVITAISYNKVGQFWTVIPYVQQDISGVGSGNANGGMADIYRKTNSFKLAMCDFMYHPSSTRPYLYNGKFMAAIKKGYECPKLISYYYKKEK